MNKSITLFSILFCTILVFSCGGKEPKEKEDLYGTRKDKEKATTKTSKNETKEIIDLTNKGIGPITSMTFDDAINKDLAKEGETLFNAKCTACHKTDKRYIGPAMKGVYEKRSPEWVMNMILNPIEMIEKDPIAKQQFMDYNQTLMINQNLSEDEARALAEYLRTL